HRRKSCSFKSTACNKSHSCSTVLDKCRNSCFSRCIRNFVCGRKSWDYRNNSNEKKGEFRNTEFFSGRLQFFTCGVLFYWTCSIDTWLGPKIKKSRLYLFGLRLYANLFRRCSRFTELVFKNRYSTLDSRNA